jgi:hypothetical protein
MVQQALIHPWNLAPIFISRQELSGRTLKRSKEQVFLDRQGHVATRAGVTFGKVPAQARIVKHNPIPVAELALVVSPESPPMSLLEIS